MLFAKFLEPNSFVLLDIDGLTGSYILLTCFNKLIILAVNH